MSLDFKQIAIKAAKQAGEIHKKYFEGDTQTKEKSSSFDLITIADTEAEKKVVELIKNNFPEHNILAEEGRYEKTDSNYCWVIDPLDGTNNFSFGIPMFCVSIALVKDNQLILGVVYDVMRDELFLAERGKGAYLNNKKIKVSDADSFDKSLLITGFYYDRGKDMIGNLEAIKVFFQKRVVGIRRLGAAALDLCYIASGRATGFWEFKLSPWDFAAGKLLVEEAGGKITRKDGQEVKIESSYIVASNGKIHQRIIDVISNL
ncbi:MAG: inositol monophosphatase [Candidatus Omnitrophica bacterium]|nr:inositol monophosphatase [Candidatus Omnitrophota bacterium]MCF7893443.1 inositol monophosphatase [Candidatus Omnitrophota bacterium]